MAQQPRGRDKNITGQGNEIKRKGEGLGTGPVGRSEGYENRRADSPSSYQGQSSGGVTRSGGKRIGIIGIIIALLFGGGFGLNSLLGGGGTNTVSPTANLFSGFTDTTTSSGWFAGSNTGTLDRSVADGARDKRTVIYGDGRDKATVMVYLCGTDLESKSGMASNDLKEMAAANIGSNVEVIIYTGGCSAWKTQGISNSVNQIYRLKNGRLTCLVRDDGRDAMTKSSTLTRFIKYCAQNYPANRNMLIMWDHGGGSISGFGYDQRVAGSGSMTIKGIDEALKAAGVKFDFVGFDACLMATLENALMLDSYTDYLIGSEETEPGVGWYYTNWLTELSKNPAMPTLDIGKIISDDFVSYCTRRCPGQKTTLSVTDLAELTATVPAAFSSFAEETASLINSKEYKVVSDARAKTREFAVSSKSDQIDLAHLAYNIGTDDAKQLAKAITGAVKYNVTSSSVTNAYGLAIYFPYKKTSRVASALKAYQDIGMDSKYAECVRSFASLESAGQIVANDAAPSSPLPSLLGSFTGQSASSAGSITSLLGSLLSGGTASTAAPATSSSLGDAMSLFGSLMGGLDLNRAAGIIADNQLTTKGMEWDEEDGEYRLALKNEQWEQIHSIALNVFYDDGEGYIDLGLDNVYKITDDGELVSDFDGTWLAIDNNVIPYYYIDTFDDGTNYTITGRSPVLLNGERADLIIVFDNENPKGYIAGARYDYKNGETDTVAKGTEALNEGDKIEFICDYYSYEGEYIESYLLDYSVTYTGSNVISNVYTDKDSCSATYLLTDIYNNEYWTPVIPND